MFTSRKVRIALKFWIKRNGYSLLYVVFEHCYGRSRRGIGPFLFESWVLFRVLQSKKLSQNSTLLKVENFISGSLARKILSKSYIHSSNWIFHFSPAFSQKYYAKNLKIFVVFLKILKTVENLGILRKSWRLSGPDSRVVAEIIKNTK